MKEFAYTITGRSPRPRSKRLREQGIGGSVSVAGSGETGGSGESGVGDGHTHENKADLDLIGTDADNYVYLTRLREVTEAWAEAEVWAWAEAEAGTVAVKEKVKAGYADEAGKAGYADEAGKAGYADEAGKASYADEAGKAGYADEAGKAVYADEAALARLAEDLTENSPVRKQFLSRISDDEAAGLIRFLKGLETGDGSWYFDESGKLVARDVTTKTLEVTGAAHFFQLIIDEVRSVGGRVVLSMASCEARKVEEYTGYYRIYFVAEGDGKSVTNEWAVGDLAICQSFNAGSGTHEDVTNKYYWRKVIGGSWAATEYEWDVERKYYYIDLSRVEGEYDGSAEEAGLSGLSGSSGGSVVGLTEGYDVPGVGDVIVQLGNWSDAERASAIVLSAYDDGWLDTEIEAPSIAQYVGVGMDETDRWNMAKCRHTWFARNGNQITGNLRVVTNVGTMTVTEYVSHQTAGLSQELDGLSQDMAELEQDVGDMSVTVTEVRNKAAELSVTVDGLSSTVSQHETSMQEVRGSVHILEQLIVSNTTQIRQNADSISAQATSLQTVQQNISDIETQFDNLSDAVGSQQETIDGLPLKTDVELAEYKSGILVESKQIALEVSEITDVRRNMLMGTQFWKNIGYDADGYRVNGSGATLIRRTSDRVNGHNSLEISSSSTSNTYGGIYFLNVPVTSGKSYTISVWAKRMSSGLGNGCSMIVHYKANSEQGTPTWQESQTLVTTANTIGEWVLVRKTITPRSGDYFVNVIFCLASSGTIRIAEPMMEESEEYTAWSPSEKDYAYVMGNMLPNSGMMTRVSSGEGLTTVYGRRLDSDEAGVYKASGTTTSTLTLLAFRKAFSQGCSYILSFYARRTSAASDYAWLSVNFNNYILVAEHSVGVSPFSQNEGNTPYSGYMKIRNVPTTWTRYWVHVITNRSVTLIPRIYIEVTDGSSASFEVKKPKLEYGAAVTEWTDSADDLAEEETVANQLHRTGINITQGTIRLSAENTIIDGDLHLRGVLVENYAETERGALVVCDMVQNKSVSVSQSVVVLPMITQQTIYESTGGTPYSHVVAGVSEAGVKLTIAAKYEPAVAKWATATPALYASYPNAMSTFHAYCTKVFADPRIASCSNYTATDVARIQPEGNGGYLVSGYEGGVFVCNGRRGRVLLLMPGQTLHLTSAIETINGADHLLWYVDNGSEFVALTKDVSISGDNWYDVGFVSGSGSAWPMEVEGSSGSEYMDSLFGARVLDKEYSGMSDVLEIVL